MAIVDFTTEQKEELERLIQDYFQQELGQEIGRFEAGYVLDFFSEKLGIRFYNKGLLDAAKQPLVHSPSLWRSDHLDVANTEG